MWAEHFASSPLDTYTVFTAQHYELCSLIGGMNAKMAGQSTLQKRRENTSDLSLSVAVYTLSSPFAQYPLHARRWFIQKQNLLILIVDNV